MHLGVVLVLTAAFVSAPFALGASDGGGDPTAFAPRCINPQHRDHKHCLNPPALRGASLSGVTVAGNSTFAESDAQTVDMLSGQSYEFSVTAPPVCTKDTPEHTPCAKIDWAVMYGSSLAKWGAVVQNTLNVVPNLGCEQNETECHFSVEYEDGDHSDLPDGTALRVTAVVQIQWWGCDKAHNFCNYAPLPLARRGGWLDWLMRLRNGEQEPSAPVRPAITHRIFPKAPAGTVAQFSHVSGDAYVQKANGLPKKARVGDFIQDGDLVGTATGSHAIFDFAIGGAGAVSGGSEVTVGERSAKAGPGETLMHQIDMGLRVGELKDDVELSTDGGVMGIKG
jgi:hypothetical protein